MSEIVEVWYPDAMELQQFIQETLQQIIQGTKSAQHYSPGCQAIVNPGTPYKEGDYGYPKQDISFDVAVTVTDSSEKGGGAKLAVWGVGIDGSGKHASENQTVSRIQFSIPLALPTQQAGK